MTDDQKSEGVGSVMAWVLFVVIAVIILAFGRCEPVKAEDMELAIFYVDTVEFKQASETIQASCPDNMPGCCVLHWKTITYWYPVLDTTWVSCHTTNYSSLKNRNLLVTWREVDYEAIDWEPINNNSIDTTDIRRIFELLR